MGLPTERDRLWNRRSVDIPPHTSKIIGPTKEEKDRANAATGRLTDQQGVSTPVTLSLIGGAALVGGVGGWFIRDAVASENPFEESIGSFPNSFNDDSGVDIEGGLPPDLERPFSSQSVSAEPEVRKANPEGVVNNEKADKLKRYEKYFNWYEDNAEIKVIPPENIYFVNLEQVKQLDLEPIINKEAETIKFILPFKVPGGTTVEIDTTPFPKESPDGERISPAGRAVIKFSSADVPIIAPADSNVYIIRGMKEFGEDPNFAYQIRIYQYFEKDNTTICWWFFSESTTKKGYFRSLLPVQDFDIELLRGTNWEKLPRVDALTELATPTEVNQPIQLDVLAYTGKVVGFLASLNRDNFLLKPQFLTGSPNETGLLLAIEK